MSTISKSRSLPYPPAAVWKVLADFAAISRWAPTVDHSSPASATTEGKGAVRRVQLGRIALLETVLEWEPDERLSYRIAGLPPAAGHVVTTWQLDPQNGGTLITVSTVIDPVPGPPGKIVGRVLGRRMGSAATDMLDGLLNQLEEIS